MKLPRYLQIALAASVLLCLWSVFSTPEPQPQEERLLVQGRPAIVASSSHTRTTTAVTNSVNLFPFQGLTVEPPQRAASSPAPEVAMTSAPPLPFQISGAWWERQQRALVLTNGERQWVICRQCRARDKIWTGDILEHNWQLVEVGADFLTIRWLPQRHDQRLALGDMTFKPKF